MEAKRILVDFDDPAVLSKWADELSVAEQDLLEAVAKVGAMPSAVLFYLKSKSGKRKTVITEADRAKYEVIKFQRRAKRVVRSVGEA